MDYYTECFLIRNLCVKIFFFFFPEKISTLKLLQILVFLFSWDCENINYCNLIRTEVFYFNTFMSNFLISSGGEKIFYTQWYAKIILNYIYIGTEKTSSFISIQPYVKSKYQYMYKLTNQNPKRSILPSSRYRVLF